MNYASPSISATQAIRAVFCALCAVTALAQQNADDALRLSAITSFLDQYTRPFTILKIGPWDDIINHIAQTYECVCVVCPCPHERLYLTANDFSIPLELDNVIVLGKALDKETLRKLGECEHFDVVIALDLTHSFDCVDQSLIHSITQLGDFSFLELPNTYGSKLPANKSPCSLAHFPKSKRALFMLQGIRRKLLRKTWLMKPITEQTHTIQSSFSEKQLIKRTGKKPPYGYRTTAWLPGINLVTFKMCRGIYPSTATVKNAMAELETVEHADWMVNNMILQGKKLTFIDLQDDDYIYNNPFRPAMKNLFHTFLDLQNPQEVESFFWATLVPAWMTVRGMTRGFRTFDQWATRYMRTASNKTKYASTVAPNKIHLRAL